MLEIKCQKDGNLLGGLVAMNFIFPYIIIYWVSVIIPIDVHIFQRGGPTTNQQWLIELPFRMILVFSWNPSENLVCANARIPLTSGGIRREMGSASIEALQLQRTHINHLSLGPVYPAILSGDESYCDLQTHVGLLLNVGMLVCPKLVSFFSDTVVISTVVDFGVLLDNVFSQIHPHWNSLKHHLVTLNFSLSP